MAFNSYEEAAKAFAQGTANDLPIDPSSQIVTAQGAGSSASGQIDPDSRETASPNSRGFVPDLIKREEDAVEEVAEKQAAYIKRDTSGFDKQLQVENRENQSQGAIATAHSSFLTIFEVILAILGVLTLGKVGFKLVLKFLKKDDDSDESLFRLTDAISDWFKTINAPWSYAKRGSCTVPVFDLESGRLDHLVDSRDFFMSLKGSNIQFFDQLGNQASFSFLKVKNRPKFLHNWKSYWIVKVHESSNDLLITCYSKDGDLLRLSPSTKIPLVYPN